MGIAYNPKVITDGLVLALDAGNTKSYPGSGTAWTDLSGNGNNGTLVNGVGYDSGNGGSLSFDGVNDYAVTSKNIINPNTDFSMSVWSYKRDASISTFLSRISAGGSLQIRLVNNAVQVVNSNVANVGTFSNTATNIGQTYNIVVTRSGNVYSCYINGVYKSQFTSSSVYSNSPNIIGSSVVGGELYNGGIHALFCYNKALSTQEVQQNFNALRGRFGV